MEKRDLVLRLIQQTAQLLRAVFNSLPPDDFQSEHQIQDFVSGLKEDINLDIENFILLENTKALDILLQIDGFNLDNIENLADVLEVMATKCRKSLYPKSVLLNQKTLFLLQYVSQTSAAFDWERENKIKNLQKRLS
ncbi:MAG: hypothetical protein LBE34_05185 [Flavobacteriaceae bacterium]|jgi:hypothetical protein|nr:hypothetical protein [Flavobacteriaceae bacterium]